MHEMSLACTVVEEVERVLDECGPKARAISVRLEVGRLRAVVPEAMEFCFEAAALGTRAEGARLIIDQIPIRVRCETCDDEWTLESVEFFCPACDGGVSVLSGKELLLRTIEIEDDEE